MSSFMGGSAVAMASQIAEGFILMSPNSIKTFTPADLNLLRAELDKLLRESRAVVPPQDDAQANQLRNRRIGRISSALQTVVNKLTTKR